MPEWYFLPFYAMLRAVPDKLLGVLTMFGAIGMLFVLPWLDTSKVRSMRYRPQAKLYFFIFVIACIILGLCGANLPDKQVIPGIPQAGTATGFVSFILSLDTYVWLSRLATAYYFAYFLVITPLLGLRETPLPVPESISAPVLAHPAGAPAGAAASPEQKG